jgi:hypothetical protein
MTTLENRPKTALIVIDVQNAVVGAAYERDAVVANVNALVDRARDEDVPVIWVQHSDEDIEKGSEGWQLVPELSRRRADRSVHPLNAAWRAGPWIRRHACQRRAHHRGPDRVGCAATRQGDRTHQFVLDVSDGAGADRGNGQDRGRGLHRFVLTVLV